MARSQQRPFAVHCGAWGVELPGTQTLSLLFYHTSPKITTGRGVVFLPQVPVSGDFPHEMKKTDGARFLWYFLWCSAFLGVSSLWYPLLSVPAPRTSPPGTLKTHAQKLQEKQNSRKTTEEKKALKPSRKTPPRKTPPHHPKKQSPEEISMGLLFSKGKVAFRRLADATASACFYFFSSSQPMNSEIIAWSAPASPSDWTLCSPPFWT